MANEAVCIETPTEFRRYAVSGVVGIAYGTLLTLDDTYANGAKATTAAGSETFAGIAWEEKSATDTTLTEITAAVNGIWDLTASPSTGITLGGIASLSGVNLIKQAIEAEMVTGDIVGKVLETTSAGEVVRVAVGRII